MIRPRHASQAPCRVRVTGGIASILRFAPSSPNRMMEPSPKLLVMEAITASRSAVRLSSPPDAVYTGCLCCHDLSLSDARLGYWMSAQSQSFPPALRSGVNLAKRYGAVGFDVAVIGGAVPGTPRHEPCRRANARRSSKATSLEGYASCAGACRPGAAARGGRPVSGQALRHMGLEPGRSGSTLAKSYGGVPTWSRSCELRHGQLRRAV